MISLVSVLLLAAGAVSGNPLGKLKVCIKANSSSVVELANQHCQKYKRDPGDEGKPENKKKKTKDFSETLWDRLTST